MRIFLGISLLLSVIVPSAVASEPTCSTACIAGHKHLFGGALPFVEDMAASNIVVPQEDASQPATSRYQVVSAYRCPLVLNGHTFYDNVGNVINDAATNLSLHAWIKITSSTVPANTSAQFTVRFTNVDDPNNPVVYGEFIRSLTGQYPQGEDFNAVALNVPAVAPGSRHHFQIEAWLMNPAGAQMTINQGFLSIQGIPPTLPGVSATAGTTSNTAQVTVNGTWQQITPTVSFDLTAGNPVYVFPEGSVQITSGTSGQKLSFGFQIDGSGSSMHTIEVGVPAHLPSGVNLFDYYHAWDAQTPPQPIPFSYVPGGNNHHTVSLWAVNRDGGSTVLENRQVSFFAIDASDTTLPMKSAIYDPAVSGNTTVTTTGDPNLVPYSSIFGGGGWTDLLDLGDYTGPASGTHSVTPDLYGEGYVEFVNSSVPQAILIGVDVGTFLGSTQVNATDFTYVEITIPSGRSQWFIHSNAARWGIDGLTNKIRIIMHPESGSVTVGKRYFGIKGINMDSGFTSCEWW